MNFGQIKNYLSQECPNLDGLHKDELTELQTGFGDLAAGFDTLARYCMVKNRAMSLRESGDIVNALNWEKKGEELFNKLPEWAKW